MDVDLGGAAEDDAVLVDDVDLAVGLDLAEDLGGTAGGVVDLVEGDPLALVVLAGALVEGERGFLADVEGLPGEQGLLLGLHDGDVLAAILACCLLG